MPPKCSRCPAAAAQRRLRNGELKVMKVCSDCAEKGRNYKREEKERSEVHKAKTEAMGIKILAARQYKPKVSTKHVLNVFRDARQALDRKLAVVLRLQFVWRYRKNRKMRVYQLWSICRVMCCKSSQKEKAQNGLILNVLAAFPNNISLQQCVFGKGERTVAQWACLEEFCLKYLAKYLRHRTVMHVKHIFHPTRQDYVLPTRPWKFI
jgi:hypothetical protein